MLELQMIFGFMGENGRNLRLAGSVLYLLPGVLLATPLEQLRQRRPMLSEIVEQLAHVGTRSGEDGQRIAGCHLRHNQKASLVFDDGGARCLTAGAQTETGGVLYQRGGERG